MRTISETAAVLNIEPAVLLALADVEGGGRAYVQLDGKPMPQIHWEAHYFHRLLPPSLREVAATAGLTRPSGDAIPNPRSQHARYRLLKRARAIDETAALSACRWGVGHVLGTHWSWLGFASPQALVAEAMSGIGGQVQLMARLIDKCGLVDALCRHDWAAFARGYHGPNHRRLGYDQGLRDAYRRHAGRDSKTVDETLLRLGSHGAEVARIQRLLRSLGHGLILDGDFGPGTTAVVRRFQREQGLRASGMVDAATEAALEALCGGADDHRALRRGCHGTDVVELQRSLNAIGCDLDEDGDFGAKTAIAVMRFQRGAGLLADGIAGPATLAALRRTVDRSSLAIAS